MSEIVAQFQADVRLLTLGVVTLASTVSGVTDVRSLKVKNVLTIPFLISGLLFHSIAPAGLGLGFAFVGMVVGIVLLLPGFLLGGVGAGDVKLLAGIGAWLGGTGVSLVFIFAGTLMVIYSIALTCWWNDWGRLLYRMRAILGAGCGSETPSDCRRAIHDFEDGELKEIRRNAVPMAAMMAFGAWILFLVRIVPF